FAGKVLRQERRLPKSVVDNAKVSDHHAIIPTEQPVILEDLDDRERKIYDLVVKRFLAVLAEPYEYEQTTIFTNIDNETFIAKGKVVKKQGWKEIYNDRFEDDTDANDQQLPIVKKGEQVIQVNLQLTNGETKPPEPFTEGTLR